ncbi:rhodanese-like domain-containing protein [Gramella sp. KN1008]|uniref:rhodanese-like domain-containing protein n=1 Tax=Gramella sp. KN1008 TaxID=2529298 RepID=UPI00103D4FDC|nr:rhodanese-like domain-containing protein [Gramella sp. KN1008]TBW28665.1 rhodanese-like domain-containing protein [Gramella sp. KN1008]
MKIEKLIKENKGSIIDVRTPMEFSAGHVEGSKNIPLTEITSRMDELKQLPSPLILCCASGMRSKQVEGFLKSQKIDCVNAGSWLEINYIKFN